MKQLKLKPDLTWEGNIAIILNVKIYLKITEDAKTGFTQFVG